jgi:hypothetical protein
MCGCYGVLWMLWGVVDVVGCCGCYGVLWMLWGVVDVVGCWFYVKPFVLQTDSCEN